MSFNMNNYNGEYTATVVDNNDEEKKGRLQVDIHPITSGYERQCLPWAEPEFPYLYKNQGMVFIPEIGSTVKVIFADGCPYKPIWTGCISHSESGNTMPDEVSPNYPNRKIIKTKTAYILYDDTDEFMEVKHMSGTDFVIDKDGNITVKGVANATYNIAGNVDINCDGNMNIQCGGEYRVNANMIYLN